MLQITQPRSEKQNHPRHQLPNTLCMILHSPVWPAILLERKGWGIFKTNKFLGWTCWNVCLCMCMCVCVFLLVAMVVSVPFTGFCHAVWLMCSCLRRVWKPASLLETNKSLWRYKQNLAHMDKSWQIHHVHCISKYMRRKDKLFLRQLYQQ